MLSQLVIHSHRYAISFQKRTHTFLHLFSRFSQAPAHTDLPWYTNFDTWLLARNDLSNKTTMRCFFFSFTCILNAYDSIQLCKRTMCTDTRTRPTHTRPHTLTGKLKSSVFFILYTLFHYYYYDYDYYCSALYLFLKIWFFLTFTIHRVSTTGVDIWCALRFDFNSTKNNQTFHPHTI